LKANLDDPLEIYGEEEREKQNRKCKFDEEE
jgi:hypothetical protein